MKIHLIHAKELTPDLLEAWSCFQQSDPSLASPFFRPEFTQAVATASDDVRVAILEADRKVAGFFPFQLLSGKTGIPVGSPICDFQGMIARKNLTWNPYQILAGCGLNAWRFDHLLVSQAPFRPFHCVYADSPYMDISGGYKAESDRQRAGGSKTLIKTMRKWRRAERDLGPVRFVAHTTDRRLFHTLIEWKQQQVQQRGEPNIGSSSCCREIREWILDQNREAFGGMLSAVYIGDRLAAIHLGMRTNCVLHGWVPVYNPAFQKYSPGMMMWMELVKTCERMGIRRIDLGKGVSEFKKRLMSGATALAEGVVDSRLLPRSLWRGWLRTSDWVRNSRVLPVARHVNKILGDPRSRLGLGPLSPRRKSSDVKHP